MRQVVPHHGRRFDMQHGGLIVQATLARVTTQPLLGIALFLSALLVVTLAWVLQHPASLSATDETVLLCLIAVVAASQWLPVRLGTTNLYLSGVPLYLLTCLFVPQVAAAACGMGMLAREISICRRCGNTAGDIGAQVGRWTLLSFGVSAVVALFPANLIVYGGALAAVLLWLGDVFTCPFVLSPMTGQDPWTVIGQAARASYTGELMQYLIALFTFALLRSGGLWLSVAYIPLIALSLVLLYLYMKSVDAMNQEPLLVEPEKTGR